MPHYTLGIDDNRYPSLLREIDDAPDPLYVRGQTPGESDCMAIIGTREASKRALKIAQQFAAALAEKGFWIVSGLARGVDAAAHLGALHSGGKTLAVMGTPIDQIYPRENLRLANAIVHSGGGLVCEYPPGTETQRSNFVERNRIVSGIVKAVLVIEAPERSGTLTTARFAGDQGRDVLVVPGPIGDPNYIGSHKLIRDGAILVQSVADVLEDIDYSRQQKLTGEYL